jgi:hypothetical protein
VSDSRLVDIPSTYVAPDSVIRELRSIDPRAELVYVHGGKWWLGLVYENIPLIPDGRAELAKLVEAGGARLTTLNTDWYAWQRLKLKRLKAQGFRRVKLPKERWPREPMWRFMIEWFRKSDYVFRHIPNSDQGWEDAFKPHEREMMNTDRVEEVKRRLVDFVHSERRSLMRRMQRGAQMGYRRAVNQ